MVLVVSLPPWCLPGCPIRPFLPLWCLPARLSKCSLPASLVSPWCLPGCPNGHFLPPWCLPGATQAVQLVLTCLPGALQAVPGASLVPPRLSIWSFPASLVSSRSFPASLVPPWCLTGCRSCLPGASLVPRRPSKMVLSCLPGASQAVQLVLTCLPGASLGPPRLSKRSFPASLVLPWCLAGCPIGPNPDFGRAPDFV